MTMRPGSVAPVLRRVSVVILLSAVLVWAVGCGRPAPIVIGGLVSETGPASTYGQQTRKGIELALAQANARGGFPQGRELKVDFRDDGSSPEKAKQAAVDLATKDKVNALIGAVTSNVAEGIMPYVIDREMLLLSPTASSARLTAIGGGWFYRTYPSDDVEVRSMAKLLQKLAIENVAVIAQNEPFGTGLAESFAVQYEMANGKVVLREVFELPLDPAVAAGLAKNLVEGKVPAVYLAGWEDQVGMLLQALAAAGYEGIKLAPSSVTPKIIGLSGKAAERLVFPQAAFHLEGDEPRVKEFVAAYTKKYGEAPTVWAAYGYDAMAVLADAIRVTRMATAGEIREALLQSDTKGVTGPLKFDKRGDVQREPHFYAVARGETLHFDTIDDSLRGLLIP
jgi:branched-chain amino acid transport system substrate-binding protein